MRAGVRGQAYLTAFGCSPAPAPNADGLRHEPHEELVQQVVEEERAEDGDHGRILEFKQRLRELLPSPEEAGVGARTKREQATCSVG